MSIKIIVLDAGHGGTDSGAVGHGLAEKDITLELARRCKTQLLKYNDVRVYLTRDDDTALTLQQRADFANNKKADYFCSFHINSATRVADGFESYRHTNATDRSKAAQNVIHRRVAAAIGIDDRGQKAANFAVLRETTMPAILTECGFINNSKEAALMKEGDWLDRVAAAHAQGIAEFLGLTAKVPQHRGSAANRDFMFKVQVGAFVNREAADKLADELREKGYGAFVVLDEIS